MSDFIEIAREFGPWAAILAVLLVALAIVLWYLKTKIDVWVDPWVKGQIDLVTSLKVAVEGIKIAVEGLRDSSERQSRSAADQAGNIEKTTEMLEQVKESIEIQTRSTDGQAQSNRLMAVTLAKMLEEDDISKERIEALESMYKKLASLVLIQDSSANKPESSEPRSISDTWKGNPEPEDEK